MRARTLIINNYDSYTFNLYQMIAMVNGEPPSVVRNDQLNWSELKHLGFDNIVISPGPGHPGNERDFGVCRSALLETDIPLLGVCLGHQGLGYVYGANVQNAQEIMHGRLSSIYHDNSALFAGIPQKFHAVRYHSLIVEDVLPECLEKIAWTDEGTIMGLRHKERPHWRVQFHPESVCTEYGQRLLENFRDITDDFHKLKRIKRNWHGFSVIPQQKLSEANAESRHFAVRVRKLHTFHNPEQVFFHLFGQEAFAFWLDSSHIEKGLSRFSFMGTNTGPLSQIVKYSTSTKQLEITQSGTTRYQNQSIFEYLDQETARFCCRSPDIPFDFNCGFVGYFGYELKGECGAHPAHISPLPDAMFIFADRVTAFDHFEEAIQLLCLADRNDLSSAESWFSDIEQKLKDLPPLALSALKINQEPPIFHLRRSSESYLNDLQECKRYLRDGESYEICLTNYLKTATTLEPLALYRNLRQVNPAPYAAFLRFDEIAILSSSTCFHYTWEASR